MNDFINDRFEIFPIIDTDFLIGAMPQLKYIKRLQKHGGIYFRPTKYFRDLDDNDSRKDIDENKPNKFDFIPGNESLTLENEFKEFKLGSESIVIDATNGSLTLSSVGCEMGGNDSIYCFSFFSENNYLTFIKDYDYGEFGNYALVITDVLELKRRVFKVLIEKGKSDVHGGKITCMTKKFMLDHLKIFQKLSK